MERLINGFSFKQRCSLMKNAVETVSQSLDTVSQRQSTLANLLMLGDRQLVRLQLVKMLHAKKCQHTQCPVPYCKTMKEVQKHRKTCTAGESCKVVGCISTSQIQKHFDVCDSNDCPFTCVDMKIKFEKQQTADKPPHDAVLQGDQVVHGPNVPAEQGPSCSGKTAEEENQMHPEPMLQSQASCTQDFLMNDIQAVLEPSVAAECGPSCAKEPAKVGSQPHIEQMMAKLQSKFLSSPDSSMNYLPCERNIQLSNSKDWRQVVGTIFRQSLVQEMVQKILPSVPASLLGNSKLYKLLRYFYKVENEIYESASTKQEYLDMMSEKQSKIKMKFEDKKQAEDNIRGTAATLPSNMPDSSKSDIEGRLPKRFSS